MSAFGAWGRAVVGDFCGGVIAWPSTSLSGLSLGSPGVWSYVFQPFFVEAGETDMPYRTISGHRPPVYAMSLYIRHTLTHDFIYSQFFRSIH